MQELLDFKKIYIFFFTASLVLAMLIRSPLLSSYCFLLFFFKFVMSDGPLLLQLHHWPHWKVWNLMQFQFKFMFS